MILGVNYPLCWGCRCSQFQTVGHFGLEVFIYGMLLASTEMKAADMKLPNKGFVPGFIDFPPRSGVGQDYGSSLAGFVDSVKLEEHLISTLLLPF